MIITFDLLGVRPKTYGPLDLGLTLTLRNIPHRRFAISVFAKERPETFLKRTFARWRERFPSDAI